MGKAMVLHNIFIMGKMVVLTRLLWHHKPSYPSHRIVEKNERQIDRKHNHATSNLGPFFSVKCNTNTSLRMNRPFQWSESGLFVFLLVLRVSFFFHFTLILLNARKLSVAILILQPFYFPSIAIANQMNTLRSYFLWNVNFLFQIFFCRLLLLFLSVFHFSCSVYLWCTFPNIQLSHCKAFAKLTFFFERKKNQLFRM